MRDERTAVLAHVVRGGFAESLHTGHVSVVSPSGEVLFASGDPDAVILPRSSVKPLQALGSLVAGAGLAGETLAIACASHAGEPTHVAAVDAVLAGAGLDRSALGNVADWPRAQEARDALVRERAKPQPVYMNCSGKHAGMLAACAANGWAPERYRDPGHPLQRRILRLIADYTGVATHEVVVDGCGAPAPSTTVAGLARGVSRLVTARPGTPERAVAEAMRDYPVHVGGTNHEDTRFMQLLPGSVAKGGAEGVFVAALGDGTTVAVKCADGSPRPARAVAIAALRGAGVELAPVPELERVAVTGGDEEVGRVVVTVGSPAEAESR